MTRVFFALLSLPFLIGCSEKPEPADVDNSAGNVESPGSSETEPVKKETPEDRSPSGRWVSGNFAGPVPKEIWRSKNGHIELVNILGSRRWIHADRADTALRTAVAFLPDGKRALSGGYDNTLKLWDVETGKELATWKGLKDGIGSLAVSPDGKRALSGSGDMSIQLWDVESGKKVATWKGHTAGVTSLAFSSDGKLALSGSGRHDFSLRLWEVESGKALATWRGHTARVTSVAITPDGKHAVSGSLDKTVRLWEVKTGKELATWKEHSGGVTSVAISPDGKQVLSGGHDKKIRLRDIKTGKELYTFKGHAGDIISVAFRSNGRQALSSGRDLRKNTILKLWDIKTGKELSSWTWQINLWVRSIVLSPDGKRVLSRHYIDGTLNLWDLESKKKLSGGSSWGRIFSLAIHPEGKRAIIGYINAGLKIWDVESGKQLSSLKIDSRPVAVWSLDGERILTGSSESFGRLGHWPVLQLWNADTEEKLATWDRGHKATIYSVAFSPDGKCALSGDRNGTLKLWDVETGKELGSWKSHSWVRSIAFSPDGKRALSGHPSANFILWDTESGKELAKWRRREVDNYATSVTPSPDGRSAIAMVWNKTVARKIAPFKLWDIEPGNTPATWMGYSDEKRSVAITADGKRALLLSGQSLTLWDVPGNREIDSIEVDGLPTHLAAFGDLVVVGNKNTTATVYRVK